MVTGFDAQVFLNWCHRWLVGYLDGTILSGWVGGGCSFFLGATRIHRAGVCSCVPPSQELKPFARTVPSAYNLETDSMLLLFWRAGKCTQVNGAQFKSVALRMEEELGAAGAKPLPRGIICHLDPGVAIARKGGVGGHVVCRKNKPQTTHMDRKDSNNA